MSCNETMINDENEYNLYVDYRTDEKLPLTSANMQEPALQEQQQQGISKLYTHACADPTFLRDRCLKNLLTSQKRYSTPSCSYFETLQKSLTPQMRKIVSEWVIEVSSTLFYFYFFIFIYFLYILTVSFVRNEGGSKCTQK